MAKVPNSPEEIFEEFVADYQQAFGDNLEAIILYGSGARSEYVPKKSDINFLIVLTNEGIEQLDRALPLIPKWRKRNVSVPLFLTQTYIQSALDSFPIEFFNMKHAYKLVFGTDVLQGLQINEKDLRLQIERELRGKLIHLREGFLNTAHDRRQLTQLLSATLPTFASIFSALLYLKHQEIPSNKEKIFTRIAESFGLQEEVFKTLLALRHGSWKGNKEELKKFALSYIKEIKKLVEIVDQMNIRRDV